MLLFKPEEWLRQFLPRRPKRSFLPILQGKVYRFPVETTLEVCVLCAMITSLSRKGFCLFSRYFAKIFLIGWMFIAALGSGVSLAGAPAAPAPEDKALAAGLVPHKALYDIQLASSKSGAQILNISGQMLYEWQPDCEAWISNHRFNLLYEYADSPAMRISSDFSIVEGFDGRSMQFISQRKRDGELFEELRGSGSLNEGNAGEAVFSLPAGLSFNLPQGSVFPMGHTLGVLDAIRSGKKFYQTVIFDGSDEEGPVEVNAFIGKSRALESLTNKTLAEKSPLMQSPARNVRLAFFPLGDDSSAPDYEMNLVLHDNGVISDMLIEYDDFSVKQTLKAIEPLSGSCEQKRKPTKDQDLPKLKN